MSVEWKINDQAFSDRGLSSPRRQLVSQAPDRFSFAAPTDADADAAFAFNEAISVIRNDTTVFVGRIKTIPRYGGPQTETINYEAHGPWERLESITYRQSWRLYDVGAAELQNKLKSRVILCQNAGGDAITTGAQIGDVIDYMVALYGTPPFQYGTPPLQKGTIAPTVTLPFDEQVTISCAEVIIKMLRWSPECVAWFDYSTDPPTLNVTARSAMPAAAYAFGSDTLESWQISPRYELQVPGVRVEFEIRHEADDQSYEAIEVQEAGDTSDPECFSTVMELAGTRISRMSQDIVTEEWPAPLTDKTWWKKQCPWIAKKYKDADITITDGKRVIEDSDPEETGTLPRILKEGNIQEWMSESDAYEEVTAKMSVKVRDLLGYDELVKEIEEMPISKKVTSTDARTRTYRHLASGEAAEEVPAGLAAAIYASWNALQYSGQVTLSEEECTCAVRPGMVVNITGGRSEWETMRAVIQQVSEDLTSGRTTVTFGAARHLGPDEIRTLMKTSRGRAASYSYIARETGLSGIGAGAEFKNGGKGPKQGDGAAGPGETTYLRIRNYSGPPPYEAFQEEIKLDPAEFDTDGYIPVTDTEDGKKITKAGWAKWRNIP